MKAQQILIAIFILISSNYLYPQIRYSEGRANLDYYPFNIGNSWTFTEYTETHVPPYMLDILKWKLEIVKDTVLSNNKQYREIVKYYKYNSPYQIYFERLDTLNERVYRYDSASDTTDYEKIVLDFTIGEYDTVFSANWVITIGFDVQDSVYYFGNKYGAVGYSHIYGYSGYGDYFLENIGLYKYTWAADFVSSRSVLEGCVINGLIYGDTLMTSVKEIRDNPDDFALFQNYPNPFNPTTRIGFRISDRGFVSLKIYDVLGNEIATLINEEKPAGIYEVEFNGHSGLPSGEARNLPSGVYFYRIQAGSYSKTMKMLLLK